MNGEVCCILQVCCPPERAKKKLSEALAQAGVEPGDATIAADFLIDHFDLAPKGLLQPLLAKAGDLARSHPHE